MILDHTNIFLIKEFYNLKANQEIELAKIRDRLFPNLSKVEKSKKVCALRDRLQAMPRDLFKISKNNGFWIYELQFQNVIFKKFEFPSGLRDGLAVRVEGRWQIVEI